MSPSPSVKLFQPQCGNSNVLSEERNLPAGQNWLMERKGQRFRLLMICLRWSIDSPAWHLADGVTSYVLSDTSACYAPEVAFRSTYDLACDDHQIIL